MPLLWAKPSQAKVLTGSRDLCEALVDVHLLAIPAFDCIAGLYDRHLTLTGNMLTLMILKSG